MYRAMQKQRGMAEAAVTEAVIKFERDFMGRGPSEARTYIIDDLVIVRLKGVITRAERHLVSVDPTGRGRELIKQSRMEILEKARPLLGEVVEKELGLRVVSMHADLSVRTGERVIIFTLDSKWCEATAENGK